MLTVRATSTVPLFLAACAVQGCAPSPSADRPLPREVETRVQDSGEDHLIRNEGSLIEGEVEAPLPRVWEALRDTYEAMEIPLGTFEPAEGRLGSPRFRARRIAGERMSRWLDCGSSITGPRADLYQVTLTVTTTVRSAGDGRSRLFTSVEASARAPDVSGSELHCSSRGRLEDALLEGVRERAVSP